MKLRNIIGSVLVLIILSCESGNTIKTGTYSIVHISRVEMGLRYIFQGVRGTICSDRSLTLNPDSSFVYSNYPFISTGIWEYKRDSLILQLRESNWIDDSLKMKYPQDKTPRISLKPVVFKVKSEYLIRFLSIGNGKKIISKLKFNMP